MFAGMNLKKAYTYLADVVDHKQVVPFRRFNGSIGRASQAKAFGETRGALEFLELPFQDAGIRMELMICVQVDGPRSLFDSSPDC